MFHTIVIVAFIAAFIASAIVKWFKSVEEVMEFLEDASEGTDT